MSSVVMLPAQYDPAVDAMMISLRPGAKSDRTVRVGEDVRVDFDAEGRAIGIEILDASEHVDRAKLKLGASSQGSD